jgi:hypothetical protein
MSNLEMLLQTIAVIVILLTREIVIQIKKKIQK